jgi:hypothetical protein
MRKLLATGLLCLASLNCHAELPVYVTLKGLYDGVPARVAAGQLEGILLEADKYEKRQERFADGRWKLSFLLAGLDNAFATNARTDTDWDRFETDIRALARKHPDSPDVWLLLAMLHESRGWAARGMGTADTVTENGLRLFRTYLAASRATLEAHPLPTNPAWHELRINVAGALGGEPRELDALFAAAIKQQPDYQSTWYTRLKYLEPQWGGSIDDMVAFINTGATIAAPPEGHAMMTRLLWIARKAGYQETADDPRIDWQKVKASNHDLLARYPDEWNAQWAFFLACTHSDKPETIRLLAQVKQEPSPALLQAANAHLFNMCQDWARGTLSDFMIRDPRTGTFKTIN